jgi:predicted ABC-type sugar transport system permease subunit
VLLGVSPDWQLVVKGVVILVTVAIDRAGAK